MKFIGTVFGAVSFNLAMIEYGVIFIGWIQLTVF